MYTYICKFFSFDIALQGRSDQCLQRCEWFVHLYESDGRRPGDPRHQGNQNSDREVLQHWCQVSSSSDALYIDVGTGNGGEGRPIARGTVVEKDINNE